jgi:TolB-like protein
VSTSPPEDASGLWDRLRRRKVVQWGAAYTAGAWALLQGLAYLGDTFHWAGRFQQIATLAVIVGLPIALVLAWYHGDRGHQRVTRAEVAIIAVLLAIGGGLLWQVAPAPEPSASGAMIATAPGATPHPQTEDERTIAVLPFVPLSDGADDAYFADGLTEELLNVLAQLPGLRVTARTSAFHFKGTSEPIQEVARQLGVAHVLEGSVRRAGNRVRVTAQLIRARDGFQLWSANYDREVTDTIAIQDDIAGRVAEALDVLLDARQREAMHRAASSDVTAFVAYQKGRELYETAHARRDDPERFFATLRESNERFDEALALEPDLFAARLFSTDIYTHQLLDPLQYAQPPLEPAAAAAAAARLRETLDLTLRNARNEEERRSAALTRIYLSEDWTGFAAASAQQFAGRNCVETEFNDAPLALGLAAAAEEFYRRAIECDPLVTDYYWNHASASLWMGDARRALASIGSARRLPESDARLQWVELLALVTERRFDEAESLVASGVETARARRDHYEVALAAGRGDAARARALWQSSPHAGKVRQLDLILLAWLGDRDAANSIARWMDSQPFGHVALAETVRHCYCGAPFDIGQTPNFRARMAESGFAWPPKKPLPTPLKDW